MRHAEVHKPVDVSPTHDFFHMMFEGADLMSTFWQPLLKSVGRWNLEVSGLGIKQGQAALQLSRDLARSFTPLDAYAAHVRYWDAMTSQYAQSQQRIAASTVKASDAAVSPSDVVPLPLKRGHDMIMLPDDESDDSAQLARKVA